MISHITGHDRRIHKSKAALKESLLALIQENDFRGITITDIVNRADLNRGTFYKHYQYKEDLMDEIINDVMADLVVSYRDPYRDIEIFEIKYLTSSAIKIFEHVHHHSDFYTLILKTNQLYYLQNRVCSELKKLFLYDFSSSQFSPTLNGEILASYQAHAIFGIMTEWIHGGFKHSPDYMAQQLLEIANYSTSDGIFKINIDVNN